jgi:hypothetical protein
MIFYVHGVAFTAWIVLLVVQASLVAGGRTELHRKMGPFSAVLAVAMVVLGTLGALIAARSDTGFIGITISTAAVPRGPDLRHDPVRDIRMAGDRPAAQPAEPQTLDAARHR